MEKYHSAATSLIAAARACADTKGITLSGEAEVQYLYTPDRPRQVIFAADKDGASGWFAYWQDPRVRRNVSGTQYLRSCLKESETVTAPASSEPRLAVPELVDGEEFDRHNGWLLTKGLPADASANALRIPGNTEIAEAVTLVICLNKAIRAPQLPEHLKDFEEQGSAYGQMVTQLGTWERLAGDGEHRRGKERLFPKGLDDLPFDESLERLHATYGSRGVAREPKLAHGMFCASALFFSPTPNDQRLWLNPFHCGHVGLKNELYDLGIMAWDAVLTDRLTTFEVMQDSIRSWQGAAKHRAVALGCAEARFDEVFVAAMIERCLGTLLADLGATGRPAHEIAGQAKAVRGVLNWLLRQ
jgi:hypothetical protein